MAKLIPLKLSALGKMPGKIRVPTYSRENLSAGILHIGLGNFHRAHQAWYLHRLFDAGHCHDWAIVGAGVRPADAVQRKRLASQDWLTTLIELDPAGKSAEIIGSMIDYVPVEETNASLIARMTEPDIRIVSLTITEGGYFIDPSNETFDASHPDILHDAANPQTPKTAFGAIVEALRQRRAKDFGSFSALSCDNLQGNGAILRQSVVSLARLSDPDLAEWINENCSFPNSMVDCIVPATGPDEIALVNDFGIDDSSPVTHENFRQWVIEDDFCAGRPEFQKVGATFVKDVHVYEALKLRILNGGHQIIAIPGELLSLRTIADAMANPLIRNFLDRVVRKEIVPHVVKAPGMDPLDYLDLITRRFSNPEIRDTTRRVAFDGSSRQPGFLFPSIRDALTQNTIVSGLALTTAMWCKYCEGVREDGSPIEPNDPNWSSLQQVAKEAKSEPRKWLEQAQYFADFGSDDRYRQAFEHWHTYLSNHGVEEAMKAYLNFSSSAQSDPISKQTA